MKNPQQKAVQSQPGGKKLMHSTHSRSFKRSQTRGGKRGRGRKSY